MASVRYIVNDVDESVAFYRDRLGFAVEKHNPGKFAALKHEDLQLFINAPGAGSAGKAGGNPTPGGWSRFMIVTKDLDRKIDQLRKGERASAVTSPRQVRGGKSCCRIRQGMSSSCSSTQTVLRTDLHARRAAGARTAIRRPGTRP